MENKKHTITLIPGDGIGPELVAEVKKCVQATGVEVEWDIQNAGLEVAEKEGSALPARVIESIRKHKIALKGPMTTPVGTGMRSVNVALRKELDLFTNLRPAKTYPGIKSRFSDEHIDLVIFRENTDDLYVGYEFKKGEQNTLSLISSIKELGGFEVSADSGISIKPISAAKTKRICVAAFDYAVKHKRKKVTCVHKANIMKFTDGLFLEVFNEVAKDYPSIAAEDKIVDNMCMQLVQKPKLYDVLVLPNLYGDIVSDLCAGLVGGLGVAPGANIGKDIAVFEAVHGSAPKYAGQNKANPTALLLSTVMMLRHIGENVAGEVLEHAIKTVIEEGTHVTYDMAKDGEGVSTSEMGDAIVKEIGFLLETL